jgi:hypothetical protein
LDFRSDRSASSRATEPPIPRSGSDGSLVRAARDCFGPGQIALTHAMRRYVEELARGLRAGGRSTFLQIEEEPTPEPEPGDPRHYVARNGGPQTVRAPRKAFAGVKADARTRTGDPFITSERWGRNERASGSSRGHESPARCPHCGGLLGTTEDTGGQSDVRGEYAGEADDDPDLASSYDDPRRKRGPSRSSRRPRPGEAGDGTSG